MHKNPNGLKQQNKHSEFNLTPDQIRRLIDGAISCRNRVALSLLAFTGIRRAELRDIQVEDIDLRLGRIFIRRGKGGKARFVFFPPHAQDDLTRLIAERLEGSLITGLTHPLSLRSINNIVARTATLAGLQNPNPRYRNVTPHLLRHSFARNWKRASGSLESLQKILGHASFSTTMDLYGTESLDETSSNYLQTINQML